MDSHALFWTYILIGGLALRELFVLILLLYKIHKTRKAEQILEQELRKK